MSALLSMTTTQPIYYAGDRLEGSIHLVTKGATPAKSLTLEIRGEQSCNYPGLFCLGAFSNKRITYRETLLVKQFNSAIKQGHYSFPFKMELPYNIPATFTIDRFNSIEFLLIGKLDGLEYRYALEIREPDRRIKQYTMKNSSAVYSEYWLCCFSHRSPSVGVELSEMHTEGIKAGGTLELIGSVDNSHGDAPFQGLEVVLTEQLFRFSEDRLNLRQIIKEHMLHTFEAFPALKKTPFKVNVQIPMVKSYTAIGNIIARQFILKIEKKCSWADRSNFLKEHLILNNDEIPEQVASRLPKDFKPIIEKIVDWKQIPQYQFKPKFEFNHNQGIRPDRERSGPSWIPSNPSSNGSQPEGSPFSEYEGSNARQPSVQALNRGNL